ncbi:MAG: hypothetical protein H6937_06005 [Burkholderiales bacterium]|nr:hypothetical protein [Burkholderiales bacterium]
MPLQHVKLGKNLHIYLLQARASDAAGYRIDELFYYCIDILGADNNRTPLFSDEELGKLTYGTHPYPSFYIPGKLKWILHGSCRKPHGGFDARTQAPLPDALAHGHTLLEQTCNDIAQRPAVLLLTGDQIYADDVAVSLLAMLRPQALAITGAQETLPLVSGAASAGDFLDPATIPLHGRKQALQEKHNGIDSGFSSGQSENHLFTFGEFAAMYVYAFGNYQAWEPVWDQNVLQNLGVADSAGTVFEKQLQPLRSYHGTLPNIRRLLANVATYMIFDDHDVTDDWNITQDWYDGVRQSPLGQRIVSNALAAYWAFQAWGNDPDNFDKDLLITIALHLGDANNDPDVGARYDLHTWKSRGWGFSVPTDPPIIAIDSRTQRQFESKYYSAQLLDRYALDWLRVEWVKLKTGQQITGDTCPILIAATPVMGYAVVEAFQHLALWFAGKVENYKWVQRLESLIGVQGYLTGRLVNTLDAESWHSNKEGFVNFMDALSQRMEITRCTFLSGDVHYAFSAGATFKHGNGRLFCYQLTSSALSNEPNANQSRFLETTAKETAKTIVQRNWSIFPSKCWKTEVQLLQAENSDKRVSAVCNLGLVEFVGGIPVAHTLLTGSGNVTFKLPAPSVP